MKKIVLFLLLAVQITVYGQFPDLAKTPPMGWNSWNAFDLNIHGVGGDDTWAAKTMEKYTNPGNKPYSYGFILEYTRARQF